MHPDVKPSNLMLTSDGKIKMMNFGIARPNSEIRTIRTTPGQALGTPAYMSPEQLRQAAPEAERGSATDIYSLCATFYELFTGTRVFRHDRETAKSVETRELQGERLERPSRVAATLPWEIDTILLGGLEPEPTDRYAAAAALVRDLIHLLRQERIDYRRPWRLRRFRLWARRNRAIAIASSAALARVAT
jgi:serine/threonine-protein kinase